MNLFAEVWWTAEVIIPLEVRWLGIVVERSRFRRVVLMLAAPPASEVETCQTASALTPDLACRDGCRAAINRGQSIGLASKEV